MRTAIIISAMLVALTIGPVTAAPNNTPHAIACMSKNGFTPEMWHARHAGTNAQVQSYIACRDGISVERAKAVGRKSGNFNTW
jgi:hypothetical protein